MSFHGMRRIPRIELLQAHCDTSALGMRRDLLERPYAVSSAFFKRDVAARWIVSVPPLVTGKRDHVWKPELRAGVDRLHRPGDYLLVMAGIVDAFGEGRARHSVEGHGADQAVAFENRPQLGRNQLDAFAADFPSCCADALDVPIPLRPVQAPIRDRLPDHFALSSRIETE